MLPFHVRYIRRLKWMVLFTCSIAEPCHTYSSMPQGLWRASGSALPPPVRGVVNTCCLDAVTTANNPFIPGMTLSPKLAGAAKQAPEGEQRGLLSV